ncbi:hypothetical protein NQ318_017319 [Aromia moschata]|uniref:Transposable element P transposase n=1 Tax=Aromia moschata TaxID=1265417 RepID=A0AAV8XWH7_9CUCU|nr:hypothetical protein NQ318_017319 [Aromia moschata]
MNDKEKHCILLFDELAIDTSIQYNRKQDCVEGVEDYGSERNNKLADHANVFMIKGAVKKLGTAKAIKLVVKECQKIGLKIVASICDQGAANVAAINRLLQETKQMQTEEGQYFGYVINEQEIVPLYDVPHLFKGLRNNLLTKDLHFEINGKKMVAKWDHILQFYFLDLSDDVRICPKLTDCHVILEKINKMKVSACTQVFSNTVGSLMKRISKWNIEHGRKLSPEAEDRAELILFLDKLFDSLNGMNRIAPSSKPLKGAVTKHSAHEAFWIEAIKVIETMIYYCNKKQRFIKPPSLSNLIKTLRVIHLFSNCEESETCEVIDNLQCFLTGEAVAGVSALSDDDAPVNVRLPSNLYRKQKSKIERCSITYIAGYFIKKIKNLIKDCEVCKVNYLYSDCVKDTEFIEARQYRQSNLIKPGSFVTYVTSQSLTLLFQVLPYDIS